MAKHEHDPAAPESEAPRSTPGAGRDCRPGRHVPRKRIKLPFRCWPSHGGLKAFARKQARDGNPDAQAWLENKGLRW